MEYCSNVYRPSTKREMELAQASRRVAFSIAHAYGISFICALLLIAALFFVIPHTVPVIQRCMLR